ncbi:MAG: AraC family transcriptional regulator [Clostridia bacterium]|nr:AraC family transcriptional regulator [Clostridia bacterium]
MFDGMEKLNDVIEYIERHVTEDLTCGRLAGIAALSEYEFRRIFSFIVGVPVAEYIRKRRLSLAAEEIAEGAVVSEVGAKYGYPSASSFTRAFKEEYGVSPSTAKQEGVRLNAFIKPRFEMRMRGGENVSYTLKKLPPFCVSGIKGESSIFDTCCCESVWERYEALHNTEAESESDNTYAAYQNGTENVVCYIGEKSETGKQGCDYLQICAGTWACFDVPSTAIEREINDLYEKILFSFLPSSIYQRDAERPNVEVFQQDGSFTVMIPVKKI